MLGQIEAPRKSFLPLLQQWYVLRGPFLLGRLFGPVKSILIGIEIVESLSLSELLKSFKSLGGDILLKLLGGVRRKSPMEPQLDDDDDIILMERKPSQKKNHKGSGRAALA